MRVLLPFLAVLAVLLSGCTDEASQPEVAGQAEPTALPEWIREVYPAPGQEVSVNQALQVDHEPLAQDEVVRLIVDGTDVTTFAQRTQTRLVYDPAEGREVIELEPGRHTARVELVTGVEAGEPGELVDAFEWSFDVL